MRKIALLVAVALLSAVPALAQQTGTIVGTAMDEQGAVLPGVGVTIESPAMIGARTTVTGAGGAYSFPALPSGEYSVTFALAGFQTVVQEGVRVSVARALTVNASLGLSGVEETVTVTGEAPVVDVRNNAISTSIERELFNAVPTGRNPWVMAGLVPGMVTGRLDVGGNNGMQQYGMEIFGSATSHQTFSVDGLKVNWPGGSGGFTMQYYDFGMYEEFNFQTSQQSAEADVAGVFMNMVTKSGGNEFAGDTVGFYENDTLQAENWQDIAEQYPSLGEGSAGNPILKMYDINATLGGPIVRDQAWFFGSYRYWLLDQAALGTRNPDGSQGVDDNLIRNAMGKITWQPSSSDRVFLMFQRNWKQRFHRRSYSLTADEHTFVQDQVAQNAVLSYNRNLGGSALLDLRVGRMWGITPYYFQDEVEYCAASCPGSLITLIDSAAGSLTNAPVSWSENPNHRNQFNASLTYFADGETQSHSIKIGAQVSREQMRTEVHTNGNVTAFMDDGVPDYALIRNTPVTHQENTNTWATFAQDNWTIGQRLTLNLGVRLDGVTGVVPTQSSTLGTPWPVPVSGFSVDAQKDGLPDWPMNIGPRLGFSYDLFGDGRTAIKGGWGRYYAQIGTQLSAGANPNSTSTSRVPWSDVNGNGLLDPGPSGTHADSPELDFSASNGFVGGVSTVYDPNSSRPYSDDASLGIETTFRDNVAVNITYHHRRHRDALGVINQARPSTAYYEVPFGKGGVGSVYGLLPEYAGLQDNFITNVPYFQSNYNGVALQVNKRFSDRWQMLGGITYSNHQGFNHGTPYNGGDWNNPNRQINRDSGSVFTEVPIVVNLAGSYLAPYGLQFSWNYRARSGNPLIRDVSTSGVVDLVQGSEAVYAAQRGTDRTETVNKLVDLGFHKFFELSDDVRIQLQLDVFNILNANHILSQRTRVGSTLGDPRSILAPRVIRLGVRFLY